MSLRLNNNKPLALYLIITVVFCSGHAFQTIFPNLNNLVMPAAAVALLFEVVDLQRMKLDKLRGVLFLFVLMIIFPLVVYLGAGASWYLTFASYVFAAYGISRLYSFRGFVSCYLRIMTAVSVVAIVGYELVQSTDVLNALPTIENINGVEYGVAGIFNYIKITPERNCGMFWEPGLFATHLSISMVLETIARKKTNILRIVIFSVGILTANSSAGFALWFLCVMLLLVKKTKMTSPLSAAMALVVMCVGIIVVLNFDQILKQTGLGDNEFFAKLSTESVEDSSRIKALEHNLKLFFSAPVAGVGVVTASAQMEHVADTSTSTYLMSIFGVLGITYTACWIIGILKLPKVNILAKVLLVVIALVIVNKEPHHQILLTWCLLFFLIKGDFVQFNEEERSSPNCLTNRTFGVVR